jgi:hypothetical protein
MSMRVSGTVSWKMLESMEGSGQPTLRGIVLKIFNRSCNMQIHNTVKMFLKGQCHEMVVEVRPWSGRLGLN